MMDHTLSSTVSRPTAAYQPALPDLFAAQVARTPDAPAVLDGDHALTYQQLDERANRLAWHLQALGVGPDTRVAVCLTRSADLVVALLAVLKAGGGYVPLDPGYPQARLAFMLDDARVAVVLTETVLCEQLPPTSAAVCCLDTLTLERYPVTPPLVEILPDHLAYILYTSGSTGQPKGVQIPQRGLVNLLTAMQHAPGLTAEDVVLAVTTIAFDIAGVELFLPLLVGARMVLVPREAATDGARLVDLLATTGATLLQATPATWRLLLAAGWTGTPGLTALTGGEALPWDLAEALLARVDRLWNLYGPTETTVYSTGGPVLLADRQVSLGPPVANNQLYVVDEQLRHVPQGTPGELLIGGDGLARGYFNRPDLTAERFVPNPFVGTEDTPGSRLYRTGDLVRYRLDGTLEYLGRIDHQVKIRGYRIELGEIETVLRQHPAVREAVVVPREDTPGDKRLVAYVEQKNKEQTNKEQKISETSTDDCSLFSVLCSPHELRELVGTRLPEYMVPSAFVVLDALPLTPNGKVDRKALPAPDWRAELDASFVAPRNPIEATLASIWAEVLDVERVGIHDNFLALGGHSLLATRISVRVREAFQVELPQRAMFEVPTVAALAERIAALKDGQTVAQVPPIQRVAHDGPLPLSFVQQRLWLTDYLDPGNPAYHVPLALRLTGPLDAAALEQSCNGVVRRHEALRTVFLKRGDLPVQVVLPELHIPLPIIDLQALDDASQDSEVERLAVAEAQRPFNLAEDQLLRMTLLRLDADEHVLLAIFHHIVIDDWSMAIFWRELSALYSAALTGSPARLPELAVQYPDVAIWQREWLQGDVRAQQVAYWSKQLHGSDSTLNLPLDRPRPPKRTFHGARETIMLPAALDSALGELSQREGTTFFMTLLAAFQVLMQRYSRQNDFVIGTPISNRPRRECEDLVGFFINMLAMRADMSGNPSFRELLARVRETALGAFAHQDLPFEQVVELVHPERDPSRHPLFQVVFALQNAPREAIQLDGMRVAGLPHIGRSAQFDLFLEMIPVDGGLLTSFEYNTDLFAPATIRRMIGHFQTLLAGIIANPDLPIADVPLLTAAEHQQILRDWNTTTAEFPAQACIHQLFEAQAARTPDASAAVFVTSAGVTQQLSYAELNRQANQLAHYLRARGVGPETCVGVCLDRSLTLIVAILGVLKAGGTYLPLDPNYPADRLQFMLVDSGAPLLITEQRLSAQLPEHTAQVIAVDAVWEKIAQESDAAPPSAVTARNLAYMIYTSGSTGRPKGVLIEHQGVANLSQAQIEMFGAGAGERVLQFAALSFDASIFEIVMGLLSGATLYLARAADLMPGPALSGLLRSQAITNVTLTPSALMALEPADLPALRTMITAGEACPAELVTRWAAPEAGRTLFNAYGPTEVTVWATTAQCTPDGTPPPIGRPIANKRIYLLSPSGQPVPVGVPGEVWIAGVGLARGYLNRPDLTAERFMPDPFSATPGWRMYRSGDLARYLPDGNIEFLGRIDQQVKLRGFRIELGEIETTLQQHPAVREAVVVVRGDANNQRLVAYVVGENLDAGRPLGMASGTQNREPQDEQRTENKEQVNKDTTDSPPSPIAMGEGGRGDEGLTADLKAYLKDRLPNYMIPSAFVVLTALPLTANGKLDHKALPAPEQRQLDRQFVAPRTALEEVLGQFWREVLGIERVSVLENFFDLGGHSLLATQVMSRVQQVLRVDLPAGQLFETPTIDALAQLIQAREAAPGRAEKAAQLLLRIKTMSTTDLKQTLQQKRSQ